MYDPSTSRSTVVLKLWDDRFCIKIELEWSGEAELSAMASASTRILAPSATAECTPCTPRGDRQQSTIFPRPSCSCVPVEQRERRFLTWRMRGSDDGNGAKRMMIHQQERVGSQLCYRGREVRLEVGVWTGGVREADEGAGEGVVDFDIFRLEAYSERVRSEVLFVTALVEDKEDQVIVFKGFSSSLTRATPDDSSEAVLPATAVIVSIDRMRGPYNPSKPQYIQQGLSWQEFHLLLQGKGL